MIPVATTTRARRLNHGLGLCVTNLDEAAGLSIAREVGSTVAINVSKVIYEAQPALYRFDL